MGRAFSRATVTVSVSALPDGRTRLDIDSSALRPLNEAHTATRAIARLLDALAAHGIGGRAGSH